MHFRIKARTDTNLCCICLEEYSDSWDESSSDSEQSWKLDSKPTHTHAMFGHNKSFRCTNLKKDTASLKNKTNEGFRNHRSFTINSRDDMKGVHQLSNKRKLSITMENTDHHFQKHTEGFKQKKNKECNCPTVDKYVPNDIYSCLFEQSIENNRDTTVINIESPAEENNVNNFAVENNQVQHLNSFSPTRNVSGETGVSIVENYYYPEIMLTDNVSYVNIPEGDDSASVTSSESEYDLTTMVDQQRSHDPHGILGLLPCGHVFHFECIFEWLKKSKNCPTCRHILTMYNIKVVKRVTYQRYAYIAKLKRTKVIENHTPKSVQRCPTKKTCYKRSVSIL